MILMRVDLPAPFSPTSAWTSPPRTVKSMSRRTVTPANDFATPLRLRTGLSVFMRKGARQLSVLSRSGGAACQQVLGQSLRGLPPSARVIRLEGSGIIAGPQTNRYDHVVGPVHDRVVLRVDIGLDRFGLITFGDDDLRVHLEAFR